MSKCIAIEKDDAEKGDHYYQVMVRRVTEATASKARAEAQEVMF